MTHRVAVEENTAAQTFQACCLTCEWQGFAFKYASPLDANTAWEAADHEMRRHLKMALSSEYGKALNAAEDAAQKLAHTLTEPRTEPWYMLVQAPSGTRYDIECASLAEACDLGNTLHELAWKLIDLHR